MSRKLKRDWKSVVNLTTMRKYLLSAVVVAVLIGGGIWLNRGRNTEPHPLDEFAKCLAEKEVTMYGADWCPHCQNEKKEFGRAFKYVLYVECPADPKRCLDLGVEGYPTWIFPDGRKLVGEQGLEKLAKESGCLLPSAQAAP